MKLEVGMYVRTKKGIAKIKTLDDLDNVAWTDVKDIFFGAYRPTKKVNFVLYDDGTVLKSSYNIIDLIEKNDFVNGHRVIQVDRESLELDIENSMYGCGCETIDGNKDIKSILTKEQFESMKYEVE